MFLIRTSVKKAAQRYGIAEMKLKQPQNSQVSGDSEWLSIRQPDFGDLLATVRIARKREFRIKFELLHAGLSGELGQQGSVEEGSSE